MKHTYLAKWLLLAVITLTALGCTGGKKTAVTPGFQQQEYQQLIETGDRYFSSMHLTGWRKAEEFYYKAYQIKAAPKLRDQRLLTLCLTAIREKDEAIINPATYEKIDRLGEFPLNTKQQYLYNIVRHYRTLPVFREGAPRPRAAESKELDHSLFDLQHSALDTYLYLYMLNYYSCGSDECRQRLMTLYREKDIPNLAKKYGKALSPLFVYADTKTLQLYSAEIEEKRPQFAEFFRLKGNLLFKEQKLKQAAVYYRKALEIIPQYNHVLNGMGNIYFFTVENYREALKYYQQTLGTDPYNPVALFGKGVSLHHLERYDESNRVLDTMLEKQPRFHGEAYYYKAYNAGLVNDPVKARRLIDLAKKEPVYSGSGEIYFFSGKLYYDQEMYNDAAFDFDFVLMDRRFSRCFPLYYLGMISVKQKRWSYFRLFDRCIQCLDNQVRAMEQQVAAIDALKLGEKEKQWMKQRKTLKLQEFKATVQSMTGQMLSIMDTTREKKKAAEELRSSRVLKEFKKLLAKDPGQLNRLDDNGSTPLHRAVEKSSIEAVRYLMSLGARLDISNGTGYVPLHWAVMLGQRDIVKLLITGGADVKVRGPMSYTPLHDAAHGGYKGIIQLLLSAGANPFAREENGLTPFVLATRERKKDIYSLLNPLHTAAQKGDSKRVEFLLQQYPREIDSRGEGNYTPLHLAAAFGHMETVRLLVQAGTDLDARGADGLTAMEMAREKGYDDVALLLRQKGTRISDDEVLKQQPAPGEAWVWYLDRFGWAVKTGSRFLVFNYTQPNRMLKNSGGNFFALGKKTSVPPKPLLATGQVSAPQLKEQRMFGFRSLQVETPEDTILWRRWRAGYSNLSFVLPFQKQAGPRDFAVAPGETRTIEGMEVTCLEMSGQALGFLVKVDGLVLYYGGSWLIPEDEATWKVFTREMDNLSRLAGAVDMVFFQVPDPDHPAAEMGRKGLVYTLEKLQPAAFYPLLGNRTTSSGGAIAGWRKGLPRPSTLVSPRSKGDRFHYRKESSNYSVKS